MKSTLPLLFFTLLPFLYSCDESANTVDRQNAAADTSPEAALLSNMTDAGAIEPDYADARSLRVDQRTSMTLEDVFAGWDGSPQEFTIDPTRGNAIEARSGTRFKIPADIFVTEDGKAPSGPVTLNVKEFYTDAEFIKANLTTTSDGKIIESAGTVYVEAESGGKKLKLKEGASYQVLFPRDERDAMEIFYGTRAEDGLINWKTESAYSDADMWNEEVNSSSYVLDGAYVPYTESYVDESTGEVILVESEGGYNALVGAGSCFISINESKLLSGWRYNCKGYAWKLDENNQTLHNYFLSTFNPSLKMIDDFCILGLESEVVFTLDKKGDIRDWYFAKKTTPEYDSLITRFIKSIPRLDLDDLVGGYATNNKCSISIGKVKVVTREAVAEQFKAKYSKEPEKPITATSKEELDYYVLNASQMGWINCDQFYTAPETVDFVVKNEWGSNATINLVFEDMNSILQGFNNGTDVVFNDVPANYKVRVLGIACADGKPSLASQSTITGDKPFALTGYKEFTLAQLDKELEKLN
ncbi:MAG: hypothetical protein JNM00_03360 [Flavobacteriales bacterium]|nr:hypothetical protein [Flavobacteriales bacterium]